MYAATRGTNLKWGAEISNGVRAPLHSPAGDGPGFTQNFISSY